MAQRINILPGVSQVNIYGVKGAIRIKVDPGKLVTRNMTFDDLAAAVKARDCLLRRGPVRWQEQILYAAAAGPARYCGRIS